MSLLNLFIINSTETVFFTQLSLKRKRSIEEDETLIKHHKLDGEDDNNVHFEIKKEYIENCKDIYLTLINMDLSVNCINKTIAEYAAAKYYRCYECYKKKLLKKDFKMCDGKRHDKCEHVYCTKCDGKLRTMVARE